jgi:hypothetical protein
MTRTAPVTHPAAPAPERSRLLDRIVSWLLYAVLLLGEAGLALLALTSVMMTDGCGSTSQDAAVCNVAYFGAVNLVFVGLLVVAAVGVPVLIVVATLRRRRSWPWPLAAILALAVATPCYVLLLTR